MKPVPSQQQDKYRSVAEVADALAADLLPSSGAHTGAVSILFVALVEDLVSTAQGRQFNATFHAALRRSLAGNATLLDIHASRDGNEIRQVADNIGAELVISLDSAVLDKRVVAGADRRLAMDANKCVHCHRKRASMPPFAPIRLLATIHSLPFSRCAQTVPTCTG